MSFFLKCFIIQWLETYHRLIPCTACRESLRERDVLVCVPALCQHDQGVLLRASLAIQPRTRSSSCLLQARGKETGSKGTREVIRVNLFRWQSQNVAYGFSWTQHMFMCNNQLWLIWFLINWARSICAILLYDPSRDTGWLWLVLTAVNYKTVHDRLKLRLYLKRTWIEKAFYSCPLVSWWFWKRPRSNFFTS